MHIFTYVTSCLKKVCNTAGKNFQTSTIDSEGNMLLTVSLLNTPTPPAMQCNVVKLGKQISSVINKINKLSVFIAIDKIHINSYNSKNIRKSQIQE